MDCCYATSASTGGSAASCSVAAICCDPGRARTRSRRSPARPPGAFSNRPVWQSSTEPRRTASRGFQSSTGHLVERALERSRNLSIAIAIVHHPRVELRLHMLLWHLADRWGQVRPDGIAIPIRIAHTLLADLIAAQRPSVSTAISELTRRGLVIPIESGGWVLRGNPPGELVKLRDTELDRQRGLTTNDRNPGNTNQRSYHAHRVAHPQATSGDLVPSLRLHHPPPAARPGPLRQPPHISLDHLILVPSHLRAHARRTRRSRLAPTSRRPDLVAPPTILPRCPNSGPSRSEHKRRCSNTDTRGSTSKAHVS